jgi:hypothetical protein
MDAAAPELLEHLRGGAVGRDRWEHLVDETKGALVVDEHVELVRRLLGKAGEDVLGLEGEGVEAIVVHRRLVPS